DLTHTCHNNLPLKCESFNSCSPQAEAFFIHTLVWPLATLLNGTRRLITFVGKKTFDTRSQFNPSSNHRL
ncbi:hypothetical protein A2U01_0107601, partial [Trifolium medium]|nr:hypothetical protein [Trifolium medium]